MKIFNSLIILIVSIVLKLLKQFKLLTIENLSVQYRPWFKEAETIKTIETWHFSLVSIALRVSIVLKLGNY